MKNRHALAMTISGLLALVASPVLAYAARHRSNVEDGGHAGRLRPDRGLARIDTGAPSSLATFGFTVTADSSDIWSHDVERWLCHEESTVLPYSCPADPDAGEICLTFKFEGGSSLTIKSPDESATVLTSEQASTSTVCVPFVEGASLTLLLTANPHTLPATTRKAIIKPVPNCPG